MTEIDLHIHSNFSVDGEFSPDQLVDLCLAAGLTHAAIADHNTVRAVEAARKAAEGTQLNIIPAIEMDCVFEGLDLHLLGYGIDHRAPVFLEFEQGLRQQEQANSTQLMHLVRQLGIDFDDALVATLAYDGVVTGEMIAEAALAYDINAENPLLDPYRGDGLRSDNPYANFFWDYCSQGKPAYSPMNYIPLARAVEMIRAHHGVPVLAHPGLQIKENPSLLAAVSAEGVAGLEVYSSYHTREQVRFYREAAQSNDLLVTCGSDFHGKTKKSILIGGIDCDGQDEQIIHALLQNIQHA
jgi:hypothetical protein